jgi:hypothetical protein
MVRCLLLLLRYLMLMVGFRLPPFHNLVFNCSQGPDGFGPSRGFERGIGGKMGGHGFGESLYLILVLCMSRQLLLNLFMR